MEATVDPPPRGPDWMPITPKTGSLFHANWRPLALQRRDRAGHAARKGVCPRLKGRLTSQARFRVKGLPRGMSARPPPGPPAAALLLRRRFSHRLGQCKLLRLLPPCVPVATEIVDRVTRFMKLLTQQG